MPRNTNHELALEHRFDESLVENIADRDQIPVDELNAALNAIQRDVAANLHLYPLDEYETENDYHITDERIELLSRYDFNGMLVEEIKSEYPSEVLWAAASVHNRATNLDTMASDAIVVFRPTVLGAEEFLEQVTN